MTAVGVAPSIYGPPSATRHQQLDGLRAYAVLLVIWSHAGPRMDFGPMGSGVYGVWVFFTLSAYLITGILLRHRSPVAFYGRRALRILPPYALLLVALVLLGFPVAKHIPSLLTFTFNWTTVRADYSLSVEHLWSLAVEEQFYLVWPLVVWRTSDLPRVCKLAIAVAVASKIALQLSGAPAFAVFFLTTSNLDCLGLGALLAWSHHTGVRPSLDIGALVGLAAIVATLFWPAIGYQGGLATGLVSVWLIDRSVRDVGGVQRRLLSWRPAVYLGTISYTIYLVQSPITWLAVDGRNDWFLWSRVPVHPGSVSTFLVVTACSIAVAALSWRYIEAPINALKARLPY